MTPMRLTSRKPTESWCCSEPLLLCLAVQSLNLAKNVCHHWDSPVTISFEGGAICYHGA